MDFLLDEGAGAKKVKNLLRKKGHNVKAANEGKLRGIKDPPLLKIAIEENRFVVTFDKLFETSYKGKQYGVILIHVDHTMTQKLAERLVWTIEYICQKSEIFLGITTVLELPTPYGSWKMYPQGDKVIIEGLNYFMDQVTITDHIELVSIPVES